MTKYYCIGKDDSLYYIGEFSRYIDAIRYTAGHPLGLRTETTISEQTVRHYRKSVKSVPPTPAEPEPTPWYRLTQDGRLTYLGHYTSEEEARAVNELVEKRYYQKLLGLRAAQQFYQVIHNTLTYEERKEAKQL